MVFNFDIEDKQKYILPKLKKYRFATNNIEKKIVFHKSFIEDAKNTTTNYTADEVIGKGGASVVYRGINKDTGEKVIIKELKTNNLNKLIREVNILKICRNIPRVIKLLDFFKNDDSYYLVFPYYNTLPTRSVFYNFGLIEIKIFMYNFLQTLDKLHMNGIIHRDLKPGNLLVKSCNDFVIIDFGISDFYIPFRKFCNKIGTRNFKAPEQLLNLKGFDYGIDIWATGLMLGEMLFQRFPFWKPDEDVVILENIYKMVGHKKFVNFLTEMNIKEKYDFIKEGTKPKKIESYFQRDDNDEVMKDKDELALAMDLFKVMMELNPYKRKNAEECLSHPFFDSVRKK